ncbi:hypothetical protein EV426DRAFT_542339, partial [Tirmania nivea]
MSTEALVSYVLDEIALDGDNGTSIPKLFDYVGQFYHNHRQRRFRIAGLFESGPAVLSNDDPKAEEAVDDSNFFPTQALDLELRKEIWKRLVSDSDFKVGKNNEGSTLELEEVEEGYEADTLKNKDEENIVDGEGTEVVTGGDVETGSQAVETSPQAIEVVSIAIENGSRVVEEPIADVSEEDARVTKVKKWRVYASLERRWKALTGHGVDHKKIPPKFFDLLTEIGRHREKGILQPTLTRVTNQDARSVGPRTAALAKMGYIEKVNVLAAKLRTSKLTLQSYATLRDLKEKKLKKKAKEAGTKVDKNSANAQWTGDTVDVRKMVEAIFAVLRQAKNQVLMHSDIKRKLGMDKSRFHFRAFARIIRRVEKTGCLKRIRVPLKLTRHKKTRTIPTGFTDKCLARCIKLIREPNEQDWEQTLSVTLKRGADDVDDETGEGGNEGDDDGEKDNDQDDELDDDAVAKLENVEGDLVEESSRIIPSWVPDRSLENIIYDAVDAAGMDGVSSMDLHQIVAGRFYYRPLDQVLRRLGDNPLKSQPPHLLRLAIIRETGIEGRHTHYRYFSYRWHDKLVKAGLGKPVGGPKKAHVKGKKKQEEKQREKEEAAPKRVTVATDDLGFSFVDKRRLLKGDGSCTIKEAQEKLAAPESAHILKGRYTIETTEGGRSSVRWSGSNRAPKIPPAGVKSTDGTVRRGRPPNWLKETRKRAAENVEVKDMPPPPPPKKPKLDENVPQSPAPVPPVVETPAPKRRGRPPKNKNAAKNTPKETKDKRKAEIPAVKKITEFFQKNTPEQTAASAVPIAQRMEITPDTRNKASRRIQSAIAPPERAKRRRSTRFTASEDAMEEAIMLAPTVKIPPVSPEGTPTPTIPTTAEGTPIPVLKGKMYRNKPATKYRLPRSEPTMVLEEIDDTPKMSYGSAGGMLMIARQRVILELLEENGGVFPGGLEIKHAFESRYKRKNPKAGQPDRRLMVSLVSSLQRSGKINQIVINFINSRGLRQMKRILADSKLPLDHPLILEMKNNIVAADGNLWFPEGTEIPKEAQKLASSVRGLPTQPGAIESVEFERMFVPPRQILQAQRAEAARQKRLSRIEKEHEFPRFTAEQKELAAKRLEYRRRRAAITALAKRVDYVEGDNDAWDAPSDNEMEVEPQKRSKWWGGLVDRSDVQELNQEKDFLNGIRRVYSWETKQLFAEDELHTYFGFNMINHFCPGPDTTGSTDFTPERASMSNLIFQPDFRKGKGNPFTAKKYGRRRKKALKALDMSGDVQKPKRRRLIGPRQKRTRREKAMAELHHGQPVDEEDAALEELPQKSQIIPRKRHLFDYEQDDVLLAAIVIVRTLFGGFDRRIDWTLVAKAFPDHDLPTLKARWPRVRDAHKTHLKKLQIDFEEVYLDAYERGEMPEITRGEIGDFDLPWHCRWFKDNVTVP